jgi:hypothetical protein
MEEFTNQVVAHNNLYNNRKKIIEYWNRLHNDNLEKSARCYEALCIRDFTDKLRCFTNSMYSKSNISVLFDVVDIYGTSFVHNIKLYTKQMHLIEILFSKDLNYIILSLKILLNIGIQEYIKLNFNKSCELLRWMKKKEFCYYLFILNLHGHAKKLNLNMINKEDLKDQIKKYLYKFLFIFYFKL